MNNAILNAPIKIFATRNVIDSCKNELKEILSELKRVKQYEELDASYRHELKMITEIIESAIQEKRGCCKSPIIEKRRGNIKILAFFDTMYL